MLIEKLCADLGIPMRAFSGVGDPSAFNYLNAMEERDRQTREHYQKVFQEKFVQPLFDQWYWWEFYLQEGPQGAD